MKQVEDTEEKIQSTTYREEDKRIFKFTGRRDIHRNWMQDKRYKIQKTGDIFMTRTGYKI
jgi:hypothetical protein